MIFSLIDTNNDTLLSFKEVSDFLGKKVIPGLASTIPQKEYTDLLF